MVVTARTIKQKAVSLKIGREGGAKGGPNVSCLRARGGVDRYCVLEPRLTWHYWRFPPPPPPPPPPRSRLIPALSTLVYLGIVHN